MCIRDSKRGYDEALLLNQDGFVAEGSGQNIFIVKDNKVITNGENASILMGITRETIIQLCHDLEIDIQITNITYEMLLNADEAFFSGTASEITPINSVDDSYIGNGKPGKITLQLKNLYLDIIHGKVSQYTHWLSPIQCVKNLTPSVAE